MGYNWNHVITKDQDYFEAIVGKDTLCVFRDKHGRKPLWMGMFEKGGSPLLLYKVTPAEYDPFLDTTTPKKYKLFSISDPEKMKRNVERCYEAGIREICV